MQSWNGTGNSISWPKSLALVRRFEQQQGAVRLGFERPTDGGGANTAMPINGALRLVMARGPSNDLSGMQDYHG